MARGWESKAVEDQQQEAERRALEASAPAFEQSPEVRARRERLESLRLSRSHTLDQLESATNPAHREMLRRTLTALEAATEFLAPNGILSVAAYPGHPGGDQEAEQISAWMKSLDSRQWEALRFGSMQRAEAPHLLLLRRRL